MIGHITIQNRAIVLLFKLTVVMVVNISQNRFKPVHTDRMFVDSTKRELHILFLWFNNLGLNFLRQRIVLLKFFNFLLYIQGFLTNIQI
jgi:hypothetical protein